MPEADLILGVGDLIDRGPKSREVVNWFMETENADTLFGNHEEMLLMVSAVALAEQKMRSDVEHMWYCNGGQMTVSSYAGHDDEFLKALEWLNERSLYYEIEGLIVSHAPLIDFNLPKINSWHDENAHMFVWNRKPPNKHPNGIFQIYGHTGQLRISGDFDKDLDPVPKSEFAICVDDSHRHRLVGIHWTGDIHKSPVYIQSEIQSNNGTVDTSG